MTYQEELDHILKTNDGFLRPQDVVDYARSPETSLHSHFTWDDTEAAEKYRLDQARAVIRIVVIVTSSDKEPIKAYVSLSSDRKENNGYRAIVQVLNDEVLTNMLLNDARRELEIFRTKYERLKDVSGMQGVFDAIDNLPDIKEAANAS